MTELSRIHPEEPGAVALLDQAITALTTALDDMPIGEVVNIKAKVATVQTATKELGMSKEAQELSTEAVRRAEWALGRAIRRGQAEGGISTHGGGRRSTTGTPTLPSPSDYATKQELSGAGHQQPGIYALADGFPKPEQFDAALAEAKEEGNLSRANVARKAAGASKDSAPARRPLPNQFFDAAYDLTKVTERIDRLVNDDRFPQNAEKVGAKHRADLLRAVELLSKALDRFPSN